jgi:polyisoprenyl-phosphate glycosyltransferase
LTTSGAQPLLSVVVPVLNEEASLPELHQRLVGSLGGREDRVEIIYVDDGSTDRSIELIEARLGETAVEVTLVRLSRNFGMEIAMSAGLDHSQGDYVALMHADLQDPPELLPEMLAAARGGADVVYARRIGRDESALKRVLATSFYELMRRIARVPYQGQAGDFRVLSRRVVEAVQRMPERRRFLRGMVAWVGYEQVPVEYRRAGRHAGRGASYPALLRLALEAMTAFSDVPLQLATLFGTLTALLSAFGALLIAALTVLGVINISVWVWVLVAVLFLSGV